MATTVETIKQKSDPLAEIGGYKVHPVANLFPMMSDSEIKALAEDIRANEQQESCTLYQGQILDGRNRAIACQKLGIEPIFSEIVDDENDPDFGRFDPFTKKERPDWKPFDPVAYVLSANLHRRHLTESQQAMVGAKIATLKRGKPSKGKSANLQNIPTVEQTAEMLNVSARSIAHAKTVMEHGSAELKEAVERGEVSVSKAAQVAKVSPPEIQLEEATYKEPRTVHVSQATGENEWYTPPDIADAAREAMGEIDLDPASCDEAQKYIKAKRFFTRTSDGLSQEWIGRVWMNPPYSRDLCKRFIGKLVAEFRAGRVSQACVLVNNATETAWLQDLLSESSAVCFLKGRIAFLNRDGNPIGKPLQGQVLVYLGQRAGYFRTAFNDRGLVFYPTDLEAKIAESLWDMGGAT